MSEPVVQQSKSEESIPEANQSKSEESTPEVVKNKSEDTIPEVKEPEVGAVKDIVPMEVAELFNMQHGKISERR